jgi:arsenate reductase (thioredoxin)
MSEIDTHWRRGLPGLAYPERYLHELSLELTETLEVASHE